MTAPAQPEDLAAAFARGKTESREPAAPATTPDGARFTDLRSPWLAQPCPVCQHTFRVNDPVGRDGAGRVVHQGAGLFCATGEPARSASADLILDFYAGLDDALPPPPGTLVTVLPEGHFLTARPVGLFGRRRCLVCAHTFRPGDRVIVCPCRPEARICQAAVHRDPANGLFCWEAWSPGGATGDCPVTSRRAP
jgi:hypothetical protein